ncbi:nicotinate-nucleotide--dimethylbenzimidazole phosphoribosyltransferase, partial [Streptomyces lonarensis]
GPTAAPPGPAVATALTHPVADPVAAGYDEGERDTIHRLMRDRRDIQHGFLPEPVEHDQLLRLLEAAHTAPAVGPAQPWDFLVIRSQETRTAVHDLVRRQHEEYAKSLPRARARQLPEPAARAVLEAPVTIVVTADGTRGGRPALGPLGGPDAAPYSAALAVENLMLAARAEGLGVGWIGFHDDRELGAVLGLPEHLEIVAYLCVGHVDAAPREAGPETDPATGRPLSWVVHEESYGRRALPGAAPHDLLGETLAAIRPLDAQSLAEAWERQRRMTKPPGALGALEVISAQLCGLTRSCPPPVPEPAALAVFAGDHGVHAQGVSSWPQEVTAQMVANFLGGGAVCNAFAAQVGAEVCVIDVGVRGELPAMPGLMPRKVRAGTGDFTGGPALTRAEVLRALEVGVETARDLVAAGNRALLTGEMGVANTTVSAALTAVFTGADAAEVTGRGSGVDDDTHARKVAVVRAALDLHRPDPADPIAVLAAVGGLEHAALTGLILGGASMRVPVILDGVTAGAAALVARAIAPESVSACVAGHRGADPGHLAALTALGLRPLVDLDLRMGEGTGALLALPVVQAAARALREVATFDSTGVAGR